MENHFDNATCKFESKLHSSFVALCAKDVLFLSFEYLQGKNTIESNTHYVCYLCFIIYDKAVDVHYRQRLHCLL